MGTQIKARRDEAVSLTLSVHDSSGGVAGLAAVVAIRLSETPDTYLDFDDLTFKASGWTTKRASLTDIGGGIYAGAPVVDLGSVTNLPGSTRSLAAEYEVTGAVDGVDVDVIEIDDSGPLLEDLHGIANNRLEVNLSTQALELYDEAGSTVIRSWDLATDGGEPVTTASGVQTKRGIPAP